MPQCVGGIVAADPSSSAFTLSTSSGRFGSFCNDGRRSTSRAHRWGINNFGFTPFAGSRANALPGILRRDVCAIVICRAPSGEGFNPFRTFGRRVGKIN